MSRDDVEIVDLETEDAAAAAFASNSGTNRCGWCFSSRKLKNKGFGTTA